MLATVASTAASTASSVDWGGLVNSVIIPLVTGLLGWFAKTWHGGRTPPNPPSPPAPPSDSGVG